MRWSFYDHFLRKKEPEILRIKASPGVTTYFSSQYVLAILLTRPGLLELGKQNLYIFQMNEHEIVKWTADF